MTDVFICGYVLVSLMAFAAIPLMAGRSSRREQRRIDAEYAEEMALYDSASRWPADGCHWCGTVGKLDHIGRCDYCAELDRLTGPKRDPRFQPFKMELIR